MLSIGSSQESITLQLTDFGAACGISEEMDWPAHLSTRWLPAEAHGCARLSVTAGTWRAWDAWQVAAVAAYLLGAGKPHALLQRAWRGALAHPPQPRRRLDALPVSGSFSTLLLALLSPTAPLRPSLAPLVAACVSEKELLSATPPPASQLHAHLRGAPALDELTSLSGAALEAMHTWLLGGDGGVLWHERLDLLLRTLPPCVALLVPAPAPADLSASLTAAAAKHAPGTVAAAVLGEGGSLIVHLHSTSSAPLTARLSVRRTEAGVRCVLDGSEGVHGSVAGALREVLVAASPVHGLPRPGGSSVRSALRVGVQLAPWLSLRSERQFEEALRDPGATEQPPLLSRLLSGCKRVQSTGGAGHWIVHMSEAEAAAALLALEVGALRDATFLFRPVVRTDEDDALEGTAALLLLSKAESELERAKGRGKGAKKPQPAKVAAPYADFAPEPPPSAAQGAMSALGRATLLHGATTSAGRLESAQAVLLGGRLFPRPLSGYWRTSGVAELSGVWAASANRATQQTLLLGALDSGDLAWALGHLRSDCTWRFTLVRISKETSPQLTPFTVRHTVPAGHAAAPRVLRSDELKLEWREESGAPPAALLELPARCTALLRAPAAAALGPLSGTWRLAQPDPRFPTADTSFVFDVLCAAPPPQRSVRLLLSVLFDKQDSWLEACVAREVGAAQFFAVAAHLSAADAAAPAMEAQPRPSLQAWKRVLVERALWSVPSADTLHRPGKLVWRLAQPTGVPAASAPCVCLAEVLRALESELQPDVWAVARAGSAAAMERWGGAAREALELPCPYEQHQHSSPLMVAATSGEVPVLRALMQLGADPRATTAPFYSAPIDWAAVRERREVVSYLLGQPSIPVTASLVRLASGRPELLELLRTSLAQSSRRKPGPTSPGAASSGGAGGGAAGGGKKGKGAAKGAASSNANKSSENKFSFLMDSGDS